MTGFNIAGTLARDTRRYAWDSKGAVDLGLRLVDVKACGLASERVHYKNGKRMLTATQEIRAKIVGPCAPMAPPKRRSPSSRRTGWS